MPSKIYGPRKRRTREHVIADQSVHFVEGFILAEGHTAERIWYDYGYDLAMRTFDDRGYVEPDSILFQIKAHEKLDEPRTAPSIDVNIRDYNLWTNEQIPVIVVVYDVSRSQAYWIYFQGYFLADSTRRSERKAKWVRIKLDPINTLNRDAIRYFRDLKNNRIQIVETLP